MHAFVEQLRPLARLLPERMKKKLRRWLAFRRTGLSDTDYAMKIAQETAIFAEQEEVHDLPPIFHYWSNTWLRPTLESFGFSNPDEFFANYLQLCHENAISQRRKARFASLGSGNCDTEVRVAQLLVDRGATDFVIECIDINETMLDRGRRLAAQTGLSANIQPVQGDFNDWHPNCRYDAVLANQSLHHVMNLEGLFAAIDASLYDDGRFITSDMIGRNGHMRWPEALSIVQEFWNELPPAYRFHTQLRRKENRFLDWDCSISGFEGIRAQDVLPLLLQHFEFELFVGYGNVVDPFIDRGFGPNFDATKAWDRDFIDRVHARDEVEIFNGNISPTHMLAVMRCKPYIGPRRFREGLSAERAARAAK